MNAYRLVTLIAVSVLVAILLASALNSPSARIADNALADTVPTGGAQYIVPLQNAPRTAPGKNYLPIIFLNSANAGGAWLLSGNGGTNPATDFLGTTNNVTLTLRVNNIVGWRLAPSGANTPNVIGGYGGNTVTPGVVGATIGGGGTASDVNSVGASYTTVGGGAGNIASGYIATVGGGLGNTASGDYATIGGGGNITAFGDQATIGGGYSNTASGDYATVGGGFANIAFGSYDIICGGEFNTASGSWSTVGGGYDNTASGTYATVGGGVYNTASDNSATIGGGKYNIASASATVGGGEFNTASGRWATIPGGYLNEATMTYTFAAGNQAQALHQGAFVWSDSSGTPFASKGNDEFFVRASGGVYFFVSPNGYAGGYCYLPANGNGWSCSSDRNLKEHFVTVQGQDILQRLSRLPITTWNMKGSSVKHIGPMAQDFYTAFGVGDNDTTISTVDAQGVALAAIQGLSQVVQDKDAQIAAQQKEIDALNTRLTALEQGTATANAFPLSPDAMLLGALVVVGIIGIGRRRRA